MKLRVIKEKVLFLVCIVPNYIEYRMLLKEGCVQKGFFNGFFQNYNGVGFEEDDLYVK